MQSLYTCETTTGIFFWNVRDIFSIYNARCFLFFVVIFKIVGFSYCRYLRSMFICVCEFFCGFYFCEKKVSSICLRRGLFYMMYWRTIEIYQPMKKLWQYFPRMAFLQMFVLPVFVFMFARKTTFYDSREIKFLIIC